MNKMKGFFLLLTDEIYKKLHSCMKINYFIFFKRDLTQKKLVFIVEYRHKQIYC